MLKKIALKENFDFQAPSALLLGGFDGVHIGHRELLKKAKKLGLPVGIMSIAFGKGNRDLFTFAERERIFRALKIDFAFEWEFSEIQPLTPQEFAALLLQEFRPQAFFCGEDFRFGAGALGTPSLLEALTNVKVCVSELLTLDGRKASTSTVKKLLAAGETKRANLLLGQPFFLSGEVVKDRQVGRTIGFPTANILYPKEKFPPKIGVYETRTVIDGKPYAGVTNFGARPTFGDERICTETYLDGFHGELYGHTLTVEFIGFLREIQKFESAEALKIQLKKDLERVRHHD